MPGKGHRKTSSLRTDAEMQNHVRKMVYEITASVKPDSFRQKIINQVQYLDGDYLEAAGLVVDSIKARIAKVYTEGGKMYTNVFDVKRFLKIAGPVMERVLMGFRFQVQEIYNEIMEEREKMLSVALETNETTIINPITGNQDTPSPGAHEFSSNTIVETTLEYHHPIIYEFHDPAWEIISEDKPIIDEVPSSSSEVISEDKPSTSVTDELDFQQSKIIEDENLGSEISECSHDGKPSILVTESSQNNESDKLINGSPQNETVNALISEPSQNHDSSKLIDVLPHSEGSDISVSESRQDEGVNESPQNNSEAQHHEPDGISFSHSPKFVSTSLLKKHPKFKTCLRDNDKHRPIILIKKHSKLKTSLSGHNKSYSSFVIRKHSKLKTSLSKKYSTFVIKKHSRFKNSLSGYNKSYSTFVIRKHSKLKTSLSKNSKSYLIEKHARYKNSVTENSKSFLIKKHSRFKKFLSDNDKYFLPWHNKADYRINLHD